MTMPFSVKLIKITLLLFLSSTHCFAQTSAEITRIFVGFWAVDCQKPSITQIYKNSAGNLVFEDSKDGQVFYRFTSQSGLAISSAKDLYRFLGNDESFDNGNKSVRTITIKKLNESSITIEEATRDGVLTQKDGVILKTNKPSYIFNKCKTTFDGV